MFKLRRDPCSRRFLTARPPSEQWQFACGFKMTRKWIELLVVVQIRIRILAPCQRYISTHCGCGRPLCIFLCARVCVDVFMQNGLCISALVSPLSPLFYPHHSLSSRCSLRAAEGRQRSLHALDCLLHCLCCFCVPVPRSLPIFVFINHNGRLLWVSWWLFFIILGSLLFCCTGFCL